MKLKILFTLFFRYGLIIPGKTSGTQIKPISKPKPAVKGCFFDDDDDDEDEQPFASGSKTSQEKKSIAQVNTSANQIKKQTQLEIEKALNEDPNVFEYDNIYDKLEEQKAKLNPKKNQTESKEPKYIAGLLKAAAKRKMDFEKLQDRKVQSEREKEGDLWSDKEVFVTSAYRKKMEERELLEEEERRQEQIEALLDVRKQKDLSGFYSNMLKVTTGELVIEEEGEKEKRLERERTMMKKSKQDEEKKQKSYRVKKDESEEESEEEEKVEQMEQDESANNEEKKVEDEAKEPLAKKSKEDEVVKTEEAVKNVKEEETNKENEPKLSKEERIRLRKEKLFTKRTVNDKFDQELSEYFIRKSQLDLKTYIERE